MGIYVQIDASQFVTNSKLVPKLIARKIAEIANRPSLKMELLQIIIKYSDQYTPYKTGALSRNYTLTEEGIVYHQPYAVYQYFGEHYHHPATGPHPLARHHWVDYAMSAHYDRIREEWLKAIVKNMTNWWK